MDGHGFEAEGRPAVKYVDDPELAYVMLRYREVHDFVHVLTGIETSVEGELVLKMAAPAAVVRMALRWVTHGEAVEATADSAAPLLRVAAKLEHEGLKRAVQRALLAAAQQADGAALLGGLLEAAWHLGAEGAALQRALALVSLTRLRVLCDAASSGSRGVPACVRRTVEEVLSGVLVAGGRWADGGD